MAIDQRDWYRDIVRRRLGLPPKFATPRLRRLVKGPLPEIQDEDVNAPWTRESPAAVERWQQRQQRIERRRVRRRIAVALVLAAALLAALYAVLAAAYR